MHIVLPRSGALNFRALRAEAQQIVNNTQRLYSIQNWREFTLGSGGTTGLEGIHNTIHTRTGGGGNMATVETAGMFLGLTNRKHN